MKKLVQTFLCAFFCLACVPSSLFAGSIEEDVKDIPGMGLIVNSIQFEGITISNFYFENDKKFIFVNKGEDFAARMHYQIDASALKTLARHHLIIGLYDDVTQR